MVRNAISDHTTTGSLIKRETGSSIKRNKWRTRTCDCFRQNKKSAASVMTHARTYCWRDSTHTHHSHTCAHAGVSGPTRAQRVFFAIRTHTPILIPDSMPNRTRALKLQANTHARATPPPPPPNKTKQNKRMCFRLDILFE